MKYPNIVNAYDIARGYFNDTQAGLSDGSWAVARPLGFASLGHRVKATWMVWTGKADALIWPGQ